MTECVAGATARLRDPEGVIAEQVTDGFGDFKFDRLPPGGDGYELQVIYRNNIAATIQIRMGESLAICEVRIWGL